MRWRLAISGLAALLMPFIPRPEVEIPIPVGFMLGIGLWTGEFPAWFFLLLLTYWAVGTAVIFGIWSAVRRWRRR